MKAKTKLLVSTLLSVSAFSLTATIVSSCINLNNVTPPKQQTGNNNEIVPGQILVSAINHKKTKEILPSQVTVDFILDHFEFSYIPQQTDINKTPQPIVLSANDVEIQEYLTNDDLGSVDITIKNKINNQIQKISLGEVFKKRADKIINIESTETIDNKIYENEAVYTLEQALAAGSDKHSYIANNPFYLQQQREAQEFFKQNPTSRAAIRNVLNKTGFSEYGDTPQQRYNNALKINFSEDEIYKIQDGNALRQSIKVGEVFVEPSTNVQYRLNQDIVTKLIEVNPYGKLPTNLYQFINTIKPTEYPKFLASISSQSRMNYEVTDIYFRVIDRYAEVEFILELTNKNNNQDVVYIGNTFNNTNSELKRNEDYFQYIFDRTISLSIAQTTDGEEFVLNSGTGWIVDRIDDPSVPSDHVKVLVATNNHVIGLSNFYKPQTTIIGGTNSKQTRWFKQQEYQDYLEKQKGLVSYEIYKDKDRYNYLLWGTAKSKSFVSNEYNLISGISYSSLAKVYNITSDNYLERTWFVPKLSAKGVSVESSYLRQWYKTKDGVGYIDNGTVDFVVVPMVLKISDIKEKLPAYYEVLNTAKEKDWYVGLGNSKTHLPQIQTFSGGYPGTRNVRGSGISTWSGAKAYGVLIQGLDRTISDESNLNYIGPQNINGNESFAQNENGYVHKYFNVGSRVISSEAIGSLGSGSSGSMIIDTNFNVIGIHFAGFNSRSIGTQNNTTIGNLLVAQSQDLEGDVDIAKSVVNKLKQENIFTYKLNPRR